MRFLLDINLPPSLCKRLISSGHQAFHAGKLRLGKAPDEILLSEAESHSAVLLTHDLDFGRLMSFSKKNQPSIVIFRLQKLNALILEDRLTKSWPLIEKPLREGALVVIEESDVRIRRLPIGGGVEEDVPGIHEPPAVYGAKKPQSKASRIMAKGLKARRKKRK